MDPREYLESKGWRNVYARFTMSRRENDIVLTMKSPEILGKDTLNRLTQTLSPYYVVLSHQFTNRKPPAFVLIDPAQNYYDKPDCYLTLTLRESGRVWFSQYYTDWGLTDREFWADKELQAVWRRVSRTFPNPHLTLDMRIQAELNKRAHCGGLNEANTLKHAAMVDRIRWDLDYKAYKQDSETARILARKTAQPLNIDHSAWQHTAPFSGKCIVEIAGDLPAGWYHHSHHVGKDTRQAYKWAYRALRLAYHMHLA